MKVIRIAASDMGSIGLLFGDVVLLSLNVEYV
jgi:hypothetical protein